MIERDDKNTLTASSRAALAINGMPPGEISNKMEAYEKLFHKWLGVQLNDEGFISERRWFTPMRAWLLNRIVGTPMKIFRSEVADLALATAKFMNDARAAGARDQFYTEYVKLVEQNRELRLFMGEHFKVDLAEAESRNIPIALLIKEILLRLKKA